MEDNTYLLEISKILNSVKGWFFAIIGVLTVLVVIIQVFKYQTGDAGEKHDATRRIKSVIIFGAGVYVLAWFAEYVVGKMSGV